MVGASVFYDVLELAGDEPIVIEAEIELLKTGDGGRHTPIESFYRPNHNFGDERNNVFYIGQIDLRDGNQLFPGKKTIATVTFMNVVGLKEKLFEGCSWRLQEGNRLIGFWRILYVLSLIHI